MSYKLSALSAAALAIAALSACGRNSDSSTAAREAPLSEAQAVTPPANPPADANIATSPDLAARTGAQTAATPAAGDASATVPEMAPTGATAPAVDPSRPSRTTSGAAPQMAPTGGERAPYVEPSGGSPVNR